MISSMKTKTFPNEG